MKLENKSLVAFFDTGAAAAILITILATGAAIVGESLSTRQTVQFQESNLRTPAGVATVYSDIEAAALRVCTSGQPRRARVDEVGSCTREAQSRAVKRLNVDALTAYSQAESRGAATFASNLTK
jgi:UrcA family protein